MSLSSQIIQYIMSGITIGSVYAITAIGFNIIYNSTSIINFAQGEFVVLGGLIMVFFTVVLKLPLIFGFILTVLLLTAVGMVMERFAIFPIKEPTVITLIIVTIAVSILFRGIAMFVWGKDAHVLPPFSGERGIDFLGASLNPQYIWVFGITVIVVIVLSLFFKYTIVGKAMTACAVNRTAASLMGINVRRMVLLSFVLSAAIGGVAGIIITPITLMAYDNGAILGLKGFGAAVLGGLGNFYGAVFAGFLLGIMESLGAGLIHSGYKDAIALLVLLLVLFIKPSGIFGVSEISEVKKF
ncbi:MAG: branched-chain amino acid ABC transporter permease [Thermodesulfobacteriota bacterium]|nr:branched-chain amino acid ABC transporter permease [Thermodesulfobacteriota bacterium]